jgi:hypothetical protein
MQKRFDTAIVWFRRDMRVDDNPALAYAAALSHQIVCEIIKVNWIKNTTCLRCLLCTNRCPYSFGLQKKRVNFSRGGPVAGGVGNQFKICRVRFRGWVPD